MTELTVDVPPIGVANLQLIEMKLAAAKELRMRTYLPFSVPQGDLPAAYGAVLDKIVAPYEEKIRELTVALAESQQARERWATSCIDIHDDLEQAHLRISELEDDNNVLRAKEEEVEVVHCCGATADEVAAEAVSW